MTEHKEIKLLEHLQVFINLCQDVMGCKILPIDEKIAFVTSGDDIPRMMIASISDDTATFDIAFSPVCPPSEVAAIITFLNTLSQYKIRISKDFYVCRDLTMKHGSEAMMAFVLDMVELLDSSTAPSKSKNDNIIEEISVKEYLKKGIFVVHQPIHTMYSKKDKDEKRIKEKFNRKKIR